MTIPRTLDTLSTHLRPLCITLDDILNTPDTCLEYRAFDIHHSTIDHCWEPTMQCNAVWLRKLVVAGANKTLMPILQVCFWAENAGVGVNQWAAEPMGTWQEKGGLTTQWQDNKVRECTWEIALSMTSRNKLCTRHDKWDLLMEHGVTRISILVSTRPPRQHYTADNTFLDRHLLKPPLDEFAEVGLQWSKNRNHVTPIKKRKFIHTGMYIITPMLLLLIMMMCRYRTKWGRNLGLQVVSDNCA